MILQNDSNAKPSAVKQCWPFQVSYVRDISLINSLEHTETMMSICFFAEPALHYILHS